MQTKISAQVKIQVFTLTLFFSPIFLFSSSASAKNLSQISADFRKEVCGPIRERYEAAQQQQRLVRCERERRRIGLAEQPEDREIRKKAEEGINEGGLSCRKSAYSEEVMRLSGAMGVYFFEELKKKEAAFKKKGIRMDVLIVARSGQNIENIQVLKDTDKNGKVLSLREMVEPEVQAARYQEDTYIGGETSLSEVSRTIRKKYGDSNRKLNFSHIGILVRKSPCQKEEWGFVHLLNSCESGNSSVYFEKVRDFFMDEPHKYRAQVIVPTNEVQEKIYTYLFGTRNPRTGEFDAYWDILNQRYNLAARFNNPNEENSNQWPLEVIAASVAGIKKVYDRPSAISFLENTGYRPSKLILSGKYALAPAKPDWLMSQVIVNKADHPYAHDFQIAEVVTALSVKEYLERTKLSSAENSFELTLPEDREALARKLAEEDKVFGKPGKKAEAEASKIAQLREKARAERGEKVDQSGMGLGKIIRNNITKNKSSALYDVLQCGRK